MTTTVKRIALLAALAVVVVTAKAQFGSYSHDLPFMGVEVTDAVPQTLPTENMVFRWRASTASPGAVSSWVDDVQSAAMTNVTAGLQPTNQNGGIYFPNASQTDSKWLLYMLSVNFKHGTNTASDAHAALIVVSNITLRVDTSNRGVFWIHNTSGNGFRLRSVSSSARWEWDWNGGVDGDAVLADYGGTMPLGIQSLLFCHTPVAASWTNGVLSATNIAITATSPDIRLLGRNASWVNSSSFEGYVLELVVWSNAPSIDASKRSQIFAYVTNTYGNFGP